MAPDTRLFYGDAALRRKYGAKKGAKAPSAALVNPMYTRQGGNPGSIHQSQFIGKQLTFFFLSLASSSINSAHDISGVGRTGQVLPSHAPIELPSHVHKEREGEISCGVQPVESPLNNDFLITPRISPRGNPSLQPYHRSTQKVIQSSASHQSQYDSLRSSSSKKYHRSQQRNSPRDSPPKNHNFLQPNRSRSTSNSPVANNEETRKKMTNLAVAKRGKEKVSVPYINSIGTWVRQRDNFPLTYDKFDDMPEHKIDRVIQNVRDHFILVPDDDMVLKAIKDVMMDAYKAYRHKLYLKYKEAGGDGFATSDGHLKALAHPPENFPNKHDWAHMCNHFTTDKFKPCDPVTFFRLTHDPENKINIFNKVCNAGCSGKRRRKAHPANYIGIPSMELSSEDDDDDDDDEDADMHESQIHEHRDAFEGSDREVKEEDEAFRDDQEEGDEENRDKELEEDCEEE
ncbi:hypothetical protein MKX03_022488 [Papaver bracteatum]|nr:hypothetical protein MKX03_022488 [Papaver bracteatum]